MSAGSDGSAVYRCQNCLDYGYRIYTGAGQSFNAQAARDNHINGEKRPCSACQPEKQAAKRALVRQDDA
ncbi:MAG: hypothetical protein WAN43_00640 [Rhodomicrobium sp.]